MQPLANPFLTGAQFDYAPSQSQQTADSTCARLTMASRGITTKHWPIPVLAC